MGGNGRKKTAGELNSGKRIQSHPACRVSPVLPVKLLYSPTSFDKPSTAFSMSLRQAADRGRADTGLPAIPNANAALIL